MTPTRDEGSPNSRFSKPEVESLWKATWRNRRELWSWDLWLAVGLAVLAVCFVKSKVLEANLKPLLLAEFGLIGALLGLVIAGLAIVIGFLGREYAVVIMESERGPSGEFWPFWYVALLAALSIITAGAGVILVAQEECFRKPVFGVTTFFASYAVLASVNLVAFVKAQGETRAFLLAREWARDRQHGKP